MSNRSKRIGFDNVDWTSDAEEIVRWPELETILRQLVFETSLAYVGALQLGGSTQEAEWARLRKFHELFPDIARKILNEEK